MGATNRVRVTPLDWAMLALAVGSVALLGWEWIADVDLATQTLIFRIDVGICAIFLVEFLWRWRREGWQRDFPIRNWYEILGMIPVSHPALRSFRLLRVVRIVILLSRMGRAADRFAGDDNFTNRLIRRSKNTIVNFVGGTMTVYILNEVAEVLGKGTYTKNVARALEAHGDDITTTVKDKLHDDPSLGRLQRLPFFDDIVGASAQVTQRIIIEFLEDPRTDDLVAEILRENIEQLQQAVMAKEQSKGKVVADPAP